MIFGTRQQRQAQFNAAISAQNSLLKVGGLIVDRKEVMFGKVDQMSREEVENRLKQLMGNVVEASIENKQPDSDLVIDNSEIEKEDEKKGVSDEEE